MLRAACAASALGQRVCRCAGDHHHPVTQGLTLQQSHHPDQRFCLDLNPHVFVCSLMEDRAHSTVCPVFRMTGAGFDPDTGGRQTQTLDAVTVKRSIILRLWQACHLKSTGSHQSTEVTPITKQPVQCRIHVQLLLIAMLSCRLKLCVLINDIVIRSNSARKVPSQS